MRDIKVRYKQTLLGPAWFIIQPLILTAVFTTMISGAAGISTGNQPAPLFYLTALIIWQYFSQIISSTSEVFKANEHLFSTSHRSFIRPPIKCGSPSYPVHRRSYLSFGLRIFWENRWSFLANCPI